MDKVKYSREELYELAWQEPVSTLSKNLKIKDYDFRKICARMQIPLPKSGHWQKIRTGKKITPPQLPIVADVEQEIDFNVIADSNAKSKAPTPLELLQKEIENQLRDILRVPTKLINPDELIVRAKEQLEKESKGYVHRGVVHTYDGRISIKVAPENILRSLRFMNTLIKTIRARGNNIIVRHSTTYAVIKGEEIEISLRKNYIELLLRKRIGILPFTNLLVS